MIVMLVTGKLSTQYCGDYDLMINIEQFLVKTNKHINIYL